MITGLDSVLRCGLWLTEMIRLPTRRRRVRHDEAAQRVQAGELLVMISNAAPDAIVTDAFRGWSARHLHITLDRANESSLSKRRRLLRHRYFQITTRPGHERDVQRRLRAFARLHLRRTSQDAVIRVIRNPFVRPASALPLYASAGPVEFLALYWQGCARTRVDRSGTSGEGIRILILDQDVHPSDLPPGVRRAGAMIREGEVFRFSDDISDVRTTAHGRLVAAIIADLAPCAQITFFGVELLESGDVSLWTLLRVLLRERDADLVNFSWEIADLTVDREEHTSFLAELFGDLGDYGSGALYLCPTGNASPDSEELSTIALPARLATVAAIGSFHERERAPDSRYGIKQGNTPHDWWLCPGGTKDFPIARIGATSMHGTSFATAFATGLLAGVAQHLTGNHRMTAVDRQFLDTCDQLEIAAGGRANQDVLKTLIGQLKSNWNAVRSWLLPAMHEHAEPRALEAHERIHHGLGLLVSDRS